MSNPIYSSGLSELPNPNADDRRYAALLVRAAQAGNITVAPRGARALYRWPLSGSPQP